MLTANAPALALLTILVGLLVQEAKSFLPASIQGDQRDATVRLLALAIGAAVQVGVYLFTAASVTRPELGAAIAAGAANGIGAVLGYHGVGAVLGSTGTPGAPAQPAQASGYSAAALAPIPGAFGQPVAAPAAPAPAPVPAPATPPAPVP